MGIRRYILNRNLRKWLTIIHNLRKPSKRDDIYIANKMTRYKRLQVSATKIIFTSANADLHLKSYSGG